MRFPPDVLVRRASVYSWGLALGPLDLGAGITLTLLAGERSFLQPQLESLQAPWESSGLEERGPLALAAWQGRGNFPSSLSLPP